CSYFTITPLTPLTPLTRLALTSPLPPPLLRHMVPSQQFPLFEVAPAMETLVVGPSAAGPSQPHSSPLTAAALAAAYQVPCLQASLPY
ncbi:unnamed protein product, partial [Closterium sp. NIES-54]